jgi:hypothetical protein
MVHWLLKQILWLAHLQDSSHGPHVNWVQNTKLGSEVTATSLQPKTNGTAWIRHLCRKITILSCQRFLVYTNVMCAYF